MTREWRMYVLIVPGVLFLLLFAYVPMLGNVVAFQDYSPFLGFTHSPWVGFSNFTTLLNDPEILTALKNTLIINFLQIVLVFPAPIALALLLNTILNSKIKRFIQSVIYLPHFLSWVIVIALWEAVLGADGLVNSLLKSGGLGQEHLMTNPAWFKVLVAGQVMWKDVGWGTIIFLASISLIDQQLYEASAVDGAGWVRRLWHVTLPGMSPVIVLLLILRMGSILSVGFEQILLQQAAVGAEAAETLDTYTYFHGVVGGDWGVAAAAGLVQGVIAACLVLGSNRLAHRFGSGGAF